MSTEEGIALAHAASTVRAELGPMLEVGGYCGKSACYIGPVARRTQNVLYSIDHHRGSEEIQPGWPWHDPELIDPDTTLMDSLPFFRATIYEAGLEDVVIAVVGESSTVAAHMSISLGFLFIDGGHGSEPARRDYQGWVPKVAVGGLLAIHDVFENPDEGGVAPYEEIYIQALNSGSFEQLSATGSLRILQRKSS